MVQFSHIFELTLAAEQANMKLRSGTHHPAENLKTLARKELMRREVARQSPVNLLVTQLLGMLIQPQRFNFDGTYLILQHLVGTKLDALQLNLGGFSFGRSGHRLRARQYGMKIADTVQMHLPPLGKVFPHDVRQASSTAETSVSVNELRS